ncbi:MAG: FHA domain-containing protein [Candidatus Brocadiaceae bacterium]|nr:FHA domain-containing protein [Candidatus Brocadiaceae bacterium]
MQEPNGNTMILVALGDDKGTTWPLTAGQSYTIGRSRKCDLRLGDRTVSARHAALESRQGLWIVRDLHSSHGTLVNKQRLLGPKPLFDRDTIQCGKTLLEFRSYEEPDPADLLEIERGLSIRQ